MRMQIRVLLLLFEEAVIFEEINRVNRCASRMFNPKIAYRLKGIHVSVPLNYDISLLTHLIGSVILKIPQNLLQPRPFNRLFTLHLPDHHFYLFINLRWLVQ